MMSLTFGLFTQVSGSGPLGPLLFIFASFLIRDQLLKERIFFSSTTPGIGVRGSIGVSKMLKFLC